MLKHVWTPSTWRTTWLSPTVCARLPLWELGGRNRDTLTTPTTQHENDNEVDRAHPGSARRLSTGNAYDMTAASTALPLLPASGHADDRMVAIGTGLGALHQRTAHR